MNGKLTINTSNTILEMALNNAIVEDFDDGVMIHADSDFVINIPRADINVQEHTENEDKYFLTNAVRVDIIWSN